MSVGMGSFTLATPPKKQALKSSWSLFSLGLRASPSTHSSGYLPTRGPCAFKFHKIV